MKNKILLEINLPHLDEKYNIFVPLNKNVANILVLLTKAIKELDKMDNINLNNASLYNSETGIIYPPETIIRESNIRNGTKLIIL